MSCATALHKSRRDVQRGDNFVLFIVTLHINVPHSHSYQPIPSHKTHCGLLSEACDGLIAKLLFPVVLIPILLWVSHMVWTDGSKGCLSGLWELLWVTLELTSAGRKLTALKLSSVVYTLAVYAAWSCAKSFWINLERRGSSRRNIRIVAARLSHEREAILSDFLLWLVWVCLCSRVS